MTRGTGVRQYRACVRCRGRKTRCDLQSVGERGKPPCAKCMLEGADCVLAGSRRGGDYSHLRGDGSRRRLRQDTQPSPGSTALEPSFDGETLLQAPAPRDEHVHDNLQNPSDALLILAHAAEDNDPGTNPSFGVINVPDGAQPTSFPEEMQPSIAEAPTSLSVSREQPRSVSAYQPVKEGSVDPKVIEQLLRHYTDNYHPFFPVVPSHVLSSKCLSDTVRNEAFLLTAILVVASRDRLDLVNVHKNIWKYMRQLILDVVLGMSHIRNVGCVEGLLLLGEWTPFNLGQADDGGEGAAWSILGLAVRLAYLLRLEESSFRGDKDLDDSMRRKRLAWTFIFVSDRQISIRTGQAFWSRGPGLSSRFTAADFPSLQPKHSYEEDFASLLQAHVELTVLFGNAHDILFASKRRTTELMIRGDYTKYLDDTGRALAAWELSWRDLAVSRHLMCCLTLMQQYLRLYVHAFAFQAVLYRSSAHGSAGANDVSRPTTTCFPDSTMASPDARHIYEAVEAAETLLKIVVEDIDPVKYLRYMPARFYLYEIHSAVFLYKAHATGAISSGKYAQTSSLVRRFTTLLETAATDENHIASRYRKLLHGLWFHRPAGRIAGNFDNVGLPSQGDESMDPLSALAPDVAMGQMPLWDAVGLQQFDCTDTVDGLFSMPPVFPWEQTFM